MHVFYIFVCFVIVFEMKYSRNEKTKLEFGDCYLLLDLGGGTADFACHEVLDDGHVSEIYHPSGGSWGSTYRKERKLDLFVFNFKTIDVFQSPTVTVS